MCYANSRATYRYYFVSHLCVCLSVWLSLFSAPEPKAQVHYCDHALSVVRLSLLTFHIFDFSSETIERNSTKLDRKQDLNLLYQVCVFRADRKNKMAATASDWLRHFGLLLWNRWMEFTETWQEARSQLPLLCVFRADRKNKMAALASDWRRHFRLLIWNCKTEFNETWQEARSQPPLPSLCFSGRSEKQNGRHGLWLAETFWTSPLKPLNGIQRNLIGSKISMASTMFVFFGPSKNKMATLASDWLRHFRLLIWNLWMEFNETWQEGRSQLPLLSLCFSGWSEKQNTQNGRTGLSLAEIIQLFLWNHWTEFN